MKILSSIEALAMEQALYKAISKSYEVSIAATEKPGI